MNKNLHRYVFTLLHAIKYWNEEDAVLDGISTELIRSIILTSYVVNKKWSECAIQTVRKIYRCIEKIVSGPGYFRKITINEERSNWKTSVPLFQETTKFLTESLFQRIF